MNAWLLLFKRARKYPYLILPGFFALMNGYFHKFKFFVLRKNIKIGKAFRVYGKFIVYGTGSVSIGDNCIIDSNLFKTTCFFTRFPSAKIEIGNNVGFNGASIQCYKKVAIGDWCNIANAYIVDSKGHFLSADRRFRRPETVESNPVIINRNVWVSANVTITDGVKIGENSVIAACSLVRSDIPANAMYAGIPAKFIKKIPKSLNSKFDINKIKSI